MSKLFVFCAALTVLLLHSHPGTAQQADTQARPPIIAGPVPDPKAIPPGTAQYQWHYVCPSNATCGSFLAFGLPGASGPGGDLFIVRANITVGAQQLPTYYYWYKTRNGTFQGFTQNQAQFTLNLGTGWTLADGGPITN
jgi:hypothetical protein